jgi:hypothetical protein
METRHFRGLIPRRGTGATMKSAGELAFDRRERRFPGVESGRARGRGVASRWIQGEIWRKSHGVMELGQ